MDRNSNRVLPARVGSNDRQTVIQFPCGCTGRWLAGCLAVVLSILTMSQSVAQSPDSTAAVRSAEVQELPGEGTSELDTSPRSTAEIAEKTAAASRRGALIASLSIFVLAIFVGFEVITKVPPTLHTPLMSGSNAISGITVVGAIAAAGTTGFPGSSFVALLAVALAMVNVVGGFLVTHRMLSMFKRR